MRTVLAFVALMAVLMAIGLAAAAVFLAPPKKHLFLPPPEDGRCRNGYGPRLFDALVWADAEAMAGGPAREGVGLK